MAIGTRAFARLCSAVMLKALFASLLLTTSASAAQLAPADRIGEQWVTSYAFLDHLATAEVTSPFLPATSPLFDRVDEAKKNGTTVQHPWGGDGPNRFMHVQVRKVWPARIQHDMRDCLVLPLPGWATFQVGVQPDSVLKFAPELVRLGGPAGATLIVAVVDGKTTTTIFERAFKGSSLWNDRWVEETISLSRWAGKKVGIRFHVDHPGLGADRWTKKSGGHKAVALFALPRVLTHLRRADTAVRAAVQAAAGGEMNDNVIMVVFDSLRSDLVAPVRDLKQRIPAITPNIDRFSKDAVRFTQAFSVGNQTRVGSYSMYLATPPSAAGIWQTSWSYSDATRAAFYGSGATTLPRILHQHGYLTGHLGYNGFLFGNLYLALDMGFDFVSEFNGVPQNTVNMTDGIVEWIKEHKDQKFFLLVWYDPPHFPYTAPPGWIEKLYAAGLSKDHRYFAHGYLAKLMYGDDSFGRLTAALEETGLTKKTLFVLTGDHGEAMDPRHDGYSHNVNTRVARMHGKTFFDEEIHVPLILRHDGVLAGRTVSAQVSNMGLAPTIQELIGLPTNLPQQLGRSFAGLARGGSEAEERLAYFEGRWSYGIRYGGYKYILHDVGEKLSLNAPGLWHRDRDGADELYDLRADPDEQVNIATTNKDALGKMRKRYDDFRKSLRDFRTGVLKGPLSRPMEPLN